MTTYSDQTKESEYQQLIGTKNEPDDLQDQESHLRTTLQTFIDLRQLPEPYYNWYSLTDKWAEYDRCYEVRAKEQSKRQDYEYKGRSNIVLPDYHATIEILKTRELNALFSGKDSFEAKPMKQSTIEDAIIARRLVKHNFIMETDYKREQTKVLQDRLNYGTCFAMANWIVEERGFTTYTDELADDDGDRVVIDGVPQKTPMPYKAKQYIEKKYTNYRHLDCKKVYIHPRIEHMKDQEATYYLMQKSWGEVLEMEADDLIAKGMADYIKDLGENYNDPDLDDAQDSRSDNDTETEPSEAKVFDIYLTYFYWGEGDDRKLYEAIYLKDDKVVGLRQSDSDNIDEFIIKTCYISIPGYAYGIGVGDQQYPSYISKCARINQVYDLSTWEIRGGGFKDANLLPDAIFQTAEPGQYYNIPGLSGLMQAGAKPLLTWSAMNDKRSSSVGLEIVETLNQSIQHGTGATNLLAGMPSDSSVDDTATGIQTAINAGNERVNSYMQKFQDENIKRYAEICYKNYQKNIDPKKDLPKILDPEELTFKDANGQEVPIHFPDYLMDVDFVFRAVEKVVEAEKRIGQMMRFISTMGQIVAQTAPIMPQLGQQLAEKFNWEYAVEEIARSIGIDDLDKLFPDFNPLNELMQCKQQLMQVQQQSEMMGGAIQETMARFKDQGNQAAVDTVNNVMMEMQEGQDGQGGQAS